MNLNLARQRSLVIAIIAAAREAAELAKNAADFRRIMAEKVQQGNLADELDRFRVTTARVRRTIEGS
jgi:Ni/Co efflux regulator RcnB